MGYRGSVVMEAALQLGLKVDLKRMIVLVVIIILLNTL